MELVVLVDEQNREIGTAPKETVHTKNTPLHRGFSLFLFNTKGEVLITRRAIGKTFEGVWTNTVCGHPAPGESNIDAAKRRLKDELGIAHLEVKEVSPYRYRAVDKKGIVENEICPILTGMFDGNPQPNPMEVSDWKWVQWNTINGSEFSPWSVEEMTILQQKGLVPR